MTVLHWGGVRVLARGYVQFFPLYMFAYLVGWGVWLRSCVVYLRYNLLDGRFCKFSYSVFFWFFLGGGLDYPGSTFQNEISHTA